MTGPLARLLDDAPVLLEGAMGTMLIARGLPLGAPGEWMTVHNPAVVGEVHRAYAKAGARVAKTNTFNANRFRLPLSGIDRSVEWCCREGARLARESVGTAGVVAGSIGPLGTMLEPNGPLTREQAVDAFAEQAAALAADGADVLLVETMYDAAEAAAGVEACRRVCSLPVIATLTFGRSPRGFHTMMGHTPEAGLPGLREAGADVVGANCTLSSADMADLADRIMAASPGPVLIQPNAGQPREQAGTLHYPESPSYFAAQLMRIAGMGVSMLGGCCGTTPAHIRELRQQIERSRSR